MSSPLLFVLIPLIVSILLWLFRKSFLFTTIAAGVLCLLLAFLAYRFPVNAVIRVGPLSFEVSAAIDILGRRLVLDSGDLPFLVFIYALGALWIMGSRLARTSLTFPPLALAMIGLLVAARAVEPFLYAALLIETAVLISIPMFSEPGTPAGPGLLRYLIFQTLGMPFILLAGWGAGFVESNPADQVLLTRTILMLGMGFVLWLAIFPFYTWMPLLAEESNPYMVGFVISLLPTVGLLFFVDFLNSFAWLRNFELLYTGLRLTGVLMVVTGGFWAVFQRSLSRMMAYAVIVETGFSLLALSLGSRVGLEIFVNQLLARVVALAAWALTISLLRQEIPLTLEGISGLLYRRSFAGASLLFSYLTLAGLPLLPVFPLRFLLLEQMAAVSNLTAVWAALGSVGLLVAGLRVLVETAKRPDEPVVSLPGPVSVEVWFQRLLMAGGMIFLILIGILPRFTASGMLRILEAFNRL